MTHDEPRHHRPVRRAPRSPGLRAGVPDLRRQRAVQRADHHAEGVRGQHADQAGRRVARRGQGARRRRRAVRRAAGWSGATSRSPRRPTAGPGSSSTATSGTPTRSASSRSASAPWGRSRARASAGCTRARSAGRSSSRAWSSARGSGCAPTGTASSSCPRRRPRAEPAGPVRRNAQARNWSRASSSVEVSQNSATRPFSKRTRCTFSTSMLRFPRWAVTVTGAAP